MPTTTLVSSAARTASGNSGALTPFANANRIKSIVFLLTVSVAATDVTDTLDVYVQHSPDGGTTYDDFVHFTQVLGNGGAKKYIATWFRDVTPESEMKAPADAALAAGVLQGPIGSTLRVKWVVVDTVGVDVSFTFKVEANPVYGER